MRRTFECAELLINLCFLAKNILWSQKVHEYTLNIIAFILIFVTLQSPPPDENHYPLQHWLVE